MSAEREKVDLVVNAGVVATMNDSGASQRAVQRSGSPPAVAHRHHLSTTWAPRRGPDRLRHRLDRPERQQSVGGTGRYERHHRDVIVGA